MKNVQGSLLFSLMELCNSSSIKIYSCYINHKFNLLLSVCVKSCFKAEVVLVNAHCHSLPAAMFV